MTKPDSGQPMFEFSAGCRAGPAQSGLEILLVLTGAAGAAVSAASAGDAQSLRLAPDWSGLLVLDRIACAVGAGHGRWRAADAAALAKLQAFLDEGRAPETAAVAGAPGLTALTLGDPQDASDRRALERWFLRRSHAPDPGFLRMAAALRRTEWYRLVRFLLTQPAHCTMQALSVRYGLSYSHFRLLCRQALGRGGKAEFQQWRNVRALLDMVDSGGNLTDVALRQGFASSSHFSDAMKGQFGISPSHLTRVLNPKQ